MAGLWAWINQDVAFVGNLYSPLLSWLGACGMLLFFTWQVLRFKKEVATVHRAFKRIHPMLTTLAEARRSLILDPFTPSPHNNPPAPDLSPGASPIRIDRDDLHKLEAGMEQDPLFRNLWRHYRMTLMVEQVPWFLEPRIFATRRAAEVFTLDALLANHLNLAFFRQVPSLITGFGLLLTFLALLVGLGKLHAEESQIVGIQGLINGLAGKFLTSIVGLSLAQLFLFMEKPLIARLQGVHRTFLDHLDQLFPRKTVEHLLDQLLSRQSPREPHGPRAREHNSERTRGWETASLAEPMAALTHAIQTLTTCQQEEQAQLKETLQDLPHRIRNEWQASHRDITTPTQDFSGLIKESQAPESEDKTFEPRPLLWKAPTYPRDSSGLNLLARITAWPNRPQPPAQRRTG